MALAIDTSIKAFVASEALTADEAQAMNHAMRDLLEVCRKAVHADKACRIAVYGSAATGLASRGSDVDTVFVGSLHDTAMTGDEVREFLANKHGADSAKGKGGKRKHRTFAAPLVRNVNCSCDSAASLLWLRLCGVCRFLECVHTL